VCDLTNESVGPSDIGAAGRPFDKVVLSGHSQGGVITQAACAVLHAEAERDIAEPERQDPWLAHGLAQQAIDKTYLVTYGSQLQFIYARLFPSYFGFALQRRLFTAKLDGRWRNLYRWTDPLGGPVLSWPLRTAKDGAGARYGPTVARWETMSCSDPGSCPGHEPEQPGHAPNEKDATFRGLTYRRWTIGPDIRLRDPALVEESAFAPRLPARGHSGYPSDPGFDEVVAELIAEAYTPADTAIDVRPKVTPSAPPLIASPPSPVLIATVLAPPILAARWVRRRRRSH
jgi:hypothetical protein